MQALRMSEKPEALRLADELEDVHTTHVARNAAAELRRLHALHEAAKQAMEALHQASVHVIVYTDGPWQQVENDCHAAIAAIRAALAQEQAESVK